MKPERILVDTDGTGEVTWLEDVDGASFTFMEHYRREYTAYIRADLVAEKDAEIARLEAVIAELNRSDA